MTKITKTFCRKNFITRLKVIMTIQTKMTILNSSIQLAFGIHMVQLLQYPDQKGSKNEVIVRETNLQNIKEKELQK